MPPMSRGAFCSASGLSGNTIQYCECVGEGIVGVRKYASASAKFQVQRPQGPSYFV